MHNVMDQSMGELELVYSLERNLSAELTRSVVLTAETGAKPLAFDNLTACEV